MHEEQRISGFVHGLKTKSLLEFLSTYLPTTYKGLMEKTYTWIEAKEVATNGGLLFILSGIRHEYAVSSLMDTAYWMSE
ncbi:hypothetical protein Tco_0965064 [Tanacetum coccineum]